MRPEQTRLTARASRAARGRLVVKADLGWIPGHPSGDRSAGGVAWIATAGKGRPAQRTTIDRERLHRATRALIELEGRFGDVLDEVLEAPRAWFAGVRCALELLKILVHRGAGSSAVAEGALETGIYRGNVVASIRSAPPVVRAVLDSAAWVCLVKPARLERIVAWTLANEGVIDRLQRSLPRQHAETASLHLVLLADEVGAHHVEPLARLLESDVLYDVPTRGEEYARALAQRLRNDKDPTDRPVATLGPALAAWATTLLTEDARTRRRALAYLGALDLAPVAAEWAVWWSRIDRCARGSHHDAKRATLARKATRLAKNAPRDLQGKSLVELLTRVLAWDDATHRGALRALAELPACENKVPVRVAFLEHWTMLADDACPGALTAYLGAFARYLADTRPRGLRRLLPWSQLFARAGTPSAEIRPPDPNLLRDVAPAKLPLVFEAIAQLLRAGGGDGRMLFAQITALASIVDLVGANEAIRAASLASALAPHYEHFWESAPLRVVFELGGDDPARFGQIAAIVARTDADADRAHLLRGLAAVREAWGDEVARTLLLEAADRLLRIGRSLAVVTAIGGAWPTVAMATEPLDSAWTSGYPAWLAPSLCDLATADPDGERTARRLLGDDIRTTSAVRRELAHLEALTGSPSGHAGSQGGNARILQRIANLRERLERGNVMRPARRARLVAKIERAACRAKLARIEHTADASLRARLPAYVGLDPPPDWLFADRTLEKLAPVPSFSSAMRAVALRLFRARAGAPPWDLRAEPANRAFLDRLARSGADVIPWLDGVGTQRVTSASGKPIDLRLEDDPLEILEMGRHFSTCLSPGSFNYFSAVANAVDVNKRVLFARDPSGAVVGRCLLALTATGGLLAFHPYAHDAQLGFDALVKTFVRDLAERMRVVITPKGDVPLLVAPDWYDDGPVDLDGRFAFLQEGSPFRLAIASQSPSTFASEAARAFSPLPLGPLTLPLLVALPELDAHPDRVTSLFPYLEEAAESLPLPTLSRAARLLAAAGHASEASRILLPRIIARVRRKHRSTYDWAPDAVASVLELSPTEGLRLLRATRSRGVRAWSEEDNPHRVVMGARAYEALRRPHRAIALYRIAAKLSLGKERKELYARADALEAREADTDS